MLKPSFDIAPENLVAQDLRNTTLLMEISESSFSYLFFERGTKTLKALKHYALEVHAGRSQTDSVEQILSSDPLLQENITDAVVVYNFPEATLIPAHLFDVAINKSITDLVHGDAQRGLVLNERVPGWNIYNSYRIQRDIHTEVQKRFAAGKYWHYYSLLLSCTQQQSIKSEAFLKLIFYADRFTVALFHHQDLYLINTFAYQTPEDVVYYLLSLLQQWKIAPSSVVIELAGLIDEQSTLYTELFKYFIELHFDSVPDEVDTSRLLEYYPAHYFSPSLRNLLCV